MEPKGPSEPSVARGQLVPASAGWVAWRGAGKKGFWRLLPHKTRRTVFFPWINHLSKTLIEIQKSSAPDKVKFMGRFITPNKCLLEGRGLKSLTAPVTKHESEQIKTKVSRRKEIVQTRTSIRETENIKTTPKSGSWRRSLKVTDLTDKEKRRENSSSGKQHHDRFSDPESALREDQEQPCICESENRCFSVGWLGMAVPQATLGNAWRHVWCSPQEGGYNPVDARHLPTPGTAPTTKNHTVQNVRNTFHTPRLRWQFPKVRGLPS